MPTSPRDNSPPPGIYYPIAPHFSREADHRFLRGWVDKCTYDANTAKVDESLLRSVDAHPALQGELQDASILYSSVPGQFQLSPGIPAVKFDPAHPEWIETIACLQTLSSLSEYPGYSDHKIEEKIHRLHALTWTTENGRWTTPFYQQPWKRNQRSGPENPSHKHDGCFSLAFNLGEGQGGKGIIQPASQYRSLEADIQRSELLGLLSEIVPWVHKCSLSKFEHEMLEWRGHVNNVPCLGGSFNVLFPDCQMNVSSLGQSLQAALGVLTGCFHVDIRDCRCGKTTMVLVLRRFHKGDLSGYFGFFVLIWLFSRGSWDV